MKNKDDEMLAEYDFTDKAAIKGRYATAYKAGHSVRIFDGDRLVSDDYFAAIEPDVREHFPDSISINKALRRLIPIISDTPQTVRK